MPARSAIAQRRLPRGLLRSVRQRLHGLPQREVPHRILVELTQLDPRPIFNSIQILLCQLAVVLILGHAKIPRAILRLVRELLLRELLDQRHHLGNALGRARDDLRPLDA